MGEIVGYGMVSHVPPIVLSEEERHRLAVHESGHTLVAHHLPMADPIYKVTVIPRGRAHSAS